MINSLIIGFALSFKDIPLHARLRNYFVFQDFIEGCRVSAAPATTNYMPRVGRFVLTADFI